MANTTNYNWETPDDTDLVKDGAAAIRTLGSSIDTTTKNLNPQTTTGALAYRSATANVNTALPIGTAGQILAVSGGVPAWINNDQGDITEVQAGVGISIASGTGPIPVITNSSTDLITTAGDLLYGSAADTMVRLGIGSNGNILTVASGVPSWAAPAGGGGMTSLAAANLPTNTNTVTLSTISADYIDLVIYVRDFFFAADDYLCLRLNGATGATDYGFINLNQSAENTAAVGADGLRDRLFFTGDDGNESADRNAFAMAQLPDYANTSHIKALYLRSVVRDQTNTYNTQAMNWSNFNSASAISSITLFTQNGNNFSGGSYVLYGVK
jgi:hypothetical protein